MSETLGATLLTVTSSSLVSESVPSLIVMLTVVSLAGSPVGSSSGKLHSKVPPPVSGSKTKLSSTYSPLTPQSGSPTTLNELESMSTVLKV